MAKVLMITHRLPYPPIKGEKIRAWHILRHLAARHDVYLISYTDGDSDADYLDTVAGTVKQLFTVDVRYRMQRFRGLLGLLLGRSASVTAYPHKAAHRQIASWRQEGEFDAVYLFSGAMAGVPPDDLWGIPTIMDFVDVDSAKWRAYSARHLGPLAWLYGLEASRLARFEAQVAERAAVSLLVSREEKALFDMQSGGRGATAVLPNGVVLPEIVRASGHEHPVVLFTGVMDYRPNIDAVCWFVGRVLPILRAERPDTEFRVAGSPVAPEIMSLAREEGVTVTGFVEDMHTEFAEAHVVVAPLRIARGVQNKILEAMAAGRVVVASRAAASGIDAQDGSEILLADDAATFAEKILLLIDDPHLRDEIGAAARARVEADYDWADVGAALDGILAERAAI